MTVSLILYETMHYLILNQCLKNKTKSLYENGVNRKLKQLSDDEF